MVTSPRVSKGHDGGYDLWIWTFIKGNPIRSHKNEIQKNHFKCGILMIVLKIPLFIYIFSLVVKLLGLCG
jgi:hypothetical protein